MLACFTLAKGARHLRNASRLMSVELHSTNPIYPSAPSPLQEFSVVYSDRALNHMSEPFVEGMQDISRILRNAYNAEKVVVIPGSGSSAMEAVARQFAADKKVLTLRNGWFSFRWTQILDACKVNTSEEVLRAHPVNPHFTPTQRQYAPHSLKCVKERILSTKPNVVFAPHVDTSTGIMLPDSYIREVSDAVHSVGGLMVLDCIASGAIWVDMQATGVDVLVSAPQKSWSGPACAGLVMLSQKALDVLKVDETQPSSFTLDLNKWLDIMNAYEAGGFAYHATMPTDALMAFRDAMIETQAYGFDHAKERALQLGCSMHGLLCNENNFVRVAAPGFESASVLVVHHLHQAAILGEMKEQGVQIAAGVPFMLGEPPETQTFRVGLFGIDKLKDIEMTVEVFRRAIDGAIGEGDEYDDEED